MPAIYLKHPRHGTKVATMEVEAVADEKNGWQRYDPRAAVPAAPVDEAPTVEASTVVQMKRGPGRPRKVA